MSESNPEIVSLTKEEVVTLIIVAKQISVHELFDGLSQKFEGKSHVDELAGELVRIVGKIRHALDAHERGEV